MLNCQVRIVDLSMTIVLFFFSSRRRHTRSKRDWSSDVCSSDLVSCLLLTSFADLVSRSFLSAAAIFFSASDARLAVAQVRSEERRVGKECRSGGGGEYKKKKETQQSRGKRE